MVGLLIGCAGFGLLQKLQSHSPESTPLQDQYPLLAKRILQDSPNDVIVNFIPLRQAIKKYLQDSGLEHSFYFEYLPTGTTIRSSESEQLAGASLLKLPTIMSLYKAAELQKINLDEEVEIQKEWLDISFGDLWRRGAGAKITLREAARIAIIDSDNTAIKIIRGSLGEIIANNDTVLSQLDVEFPFAEATGQSQVSARDYANLLRCLYLSCYLAKDNSQEILARMTEAKDFGRIEAGVPDTVKVARKIGVFEDTVQSDCAIVYVPNRPYMLCILLKAPVNQASQHMATLSEIIYSFVSDQDK